MFEVETQVLASAQAAGAIVVDVREPSEYATGHVPGARSLELVSFMRAVGYDAYSVAGGMWAWQENGRSPYGGVATDNAQELS